MATQAIPPFPSWRNCPKISGIAISHHVAGAAGDAKCLPMARQVSEKCPPTVCQGVTWPVWSRVRKRHFFIYSSINGFYKSGVKKPSTTFLQCQSLLTSSLRAVRSEYPAYIMFPFIYKRGGGGGGGEAICSQSASVHSTGNISAEDSEHQEQIRQQQHMYNSKLFVLFPLKSTAAHSLHFQHL